MTIGERLRFERERLGYNQTDFAALAGTTKKSQIDYEKEQTSPRADYLEIIAKFGADTTYIITGVRLGSMGLSGSPDNNLFFNTVGERVRAIRKGLGVGEFANALGINRKTVTRWEADQALPDGASLLALNEKFGADPGWVLVGDGEGPDLNTLTAEERLVLELFRKSPKAVRTLVMEGLRGVNNAE